MDEVDVGLPVDGMRPVAKSGKRRNSAASMMPWVPACAGMTGNYFSSANASNRCRPDSMCSCPYCFAFAALPLAMAS